MNNAIIATIKSVLHTSKRYNREVCDSLAREIASFMEANTTEIAAQYNGDSLDIAESFTRDYLSELS